jgi:hypothetical protein
VTPLTKTENATIEAYQRACYDFKQAISTVIHRENTNASLEEAKKIAVTWLQETSLDDLLRVYIRTAQQRAPIERATANEVVLAFFQARCTPDEFITFFAETIASNPGWEPKLTEVINQMSLAGYNYFLLDEAALLNELSFFAATGRSRVEYLWRHRDCFAPPITDAEFTLARVLLESWPGTLVSLVETARTLIKN